ncbi:iron uptake system protein EfeO [Streptomyces sp. ODS28]|uniref:iron uptake system protein EfeO n=1 Tax=Streptomyces sp. ODS28 TaxID=3136688 RepID=UPI0031E93B4C
MQNIRPLTAVALAAALTATAAGCAKKTDVGAAEKNGAVGVTASDSACSVSKKEFPAGHVKLAVQNKGSKVTEVYVYAPGDRIVTERENIGPGTSTTVTAEVKAGSYEIACKPGMKGHGIRQKVKATGEGGSAKEMDPRLAKAVASYRSYVQKQADETLPAARKFADAVKKGDADEAKKQYAVSRIGWERTEPVAESFGDIDPKVDVRADGVEKGGKFTGWHRLEKALWKDEKIGGKEKDLAGRLVTDLEDWKKRVGTAEITPTSMANGAKELLDEVATGKVTGEEERYSHTDLVDFHANVEGAKKSYELLRPAAKESDPLLVKKLDSEFDALFSQLDEHREGGGEGPADFVSYDTVGKGERKKLSDGVNALAEPLSQLAGAVAKTQSASAK